VIKMRKRAILAVLFLLGLSIALSGGMALAQLGHTPHENPDEVDDALNVPAYLFLCSDAIEILVGEREDIERLFEELEDSPIPDDLINMLESYRDLLTELNGDLDELAHLLGEGDEAGDVQEYLDRNQLEEAEALLDDAQELITEGGELLEDADDATNALHNRLEGLTSISAVAEKLNEARGAVDSGLERLEGMEDQHASLQEKLRLRMEEKRASLSPTNLTLSLDRQEAFVGEAIEISGALKAEGVPLLEREIRIFLDGDVVVKISTGNDGEYGDTVEVPYKYIPEVLLQAQYLPMGEDLNSYTECTSDGESLQVQFYPTELTLAANTTQPFVGETIDVSGTLTHSEDEPVPNRDVQIRLDEEVMAAATTAHNGSYSIQMDVPYEYIRERTLYASYVPKGDPGDIYGGSEAEAQLEIQFYETGIEIDAPTEVYPGFPFAVSGRVSSQGPDMPERVIQVSLGNESVEMMTGDVFDLTLTPSVEAPDSNATIAVTVEPSGEYAGVAEEIPVTIAKCLPTMTVSAPTITLCPGTVHLHGEAHCDEFGPVGGAVVKASLGKSTATTQTAEDGSFSMSLSLPPDMIQAFSEDLVIEVDPAQPWLSSCDETANVYVANPLFLGLAATALVSVGLVIYRGRGGLAEEEILPTLDVLPPTPKQVSRSTAAMASGILGSYASALRDVEAATGVVLRPEMTLRDFLDSVETHPDLSSAARSFTQLTDLAERALYSPYILERGEERWAKLLSRMVRDELEGQC
jgi:hypothetical protein